MCGTVGLFVGCAAAAFCPVQELRRTATLPTDYRSAFTRWDTKASVRSAPRRELSSQTHDLFPAELVPVAAHPLVAGLPHQVRDQLLTQQLYRYLRFTAKLEYLVVNHVAIGIAHGSIQVPVPEQMRFDALKIYTDEAYHSFFSVDLARQVQHKTGLMPRSGEPYFLTRLAQTKEQHDSARSGLIDLLFTIVSETLITSTLTGVSQASSVDPSVAQVVQDHAIDEGRHHAYFASYLRFLWGALSDGDRVFASRLFPELIDIFLRPDTADIAAELASYGLSQDSVAQVLAETFTEEVQAAYNRETAAKLLGYLNSVGVFEDTHAIDIAHKAKLLDIT